jgi:hypothetical protein
MVVDMCELIKSLEEGIKVRDKQIEEMHVINKELARRLIPINFITFYKLSKSDYCKSNRSILLFGTVYNRILTSILCRFDFLLSSLTNEKIYTFQPDCNKHSMVPLSIHGCY